MGSQVEKMRERTKADGGNFEVINIVTLNPHQSIVEMSFRKMNTRAITLLY